MTTIRTSQKKYSNLCVLCDIRSAVGSSWCHLLS